MNDWNSSVTRHCSNAFVISGTRKLLLIWNKKLDLWLPPGGALKEKEYPISGALRELKEETGIRSAFLKSVLASVPPLSIGPACDYFPLSEKNQLPTAFFTIKGVFHVAHSFLWAWPSVDAPVLDVDLNEVSGYRWLSLDDKSEKESIATRTSENIWFLMNWVSNCYPGKYVPEDNDEDYP